MTIFWGLMIPFIGTTLGALCVLFIKNEFPNDRHQKNDFANN